MNMFIGLKYHLCQGIYLSFESSHFGKYRNRQLTQNYNPSIMTMNGRVSLSGRGSMHGSSVQNVILCLSPSLIGGVSKPLADE